MTGEEELGGDPPCWAHLFEEVTASSGIETADRAGSAETAMLSTDSHQMVDLAALTRAATAPGAVWTRHSDDLDVNLLVFPSGEGVAEHMNDEVDVLLVGITGAGAVTIDGTRHVLSAGHAVVIPRGASRGIQTMNEPFACLSCHRCRGGLWPRD